VLDKAVVRAEQALSLRSDMNQEHLLVLGDMICDKVYEHSHTNKHVMPTGADGKRKGV